MTQINFNHELNGIEISFENKPEAATIEVLKSNGFRWHKVKKLWYAKNTAERLALAESLTDGQQIPAPVKESTPAPVYNLENLGANKPNCYGGAELSKAIREELKRRGVKNCTVKVSNYDHIYITWKASADDFASLEEAANRCNIWDLFRYSRVYKDGREIYETEYNEMTDEEKTAALRETVSRDINRFSNVYAGTWHELRNDRNYYNELSAKGYKTLSAIIAIGNQWNYDNSDSMTDYFEVGYILDIDIVKPDNFEIREEMTDAERKAYEEEQDAKRKELEEADRKAEEERKQAKEEAKKRKAWEEEARARITNNIEVVDLAEAENLYITDLHSGCGKECGLDEVHESIAERSASFEDAEITRKIIFTNKAAFTDFCNMFLYDFDFLEGKGGSGTVDARLLENMNLYSLNTAQRESVKFYICNAIAVYFDNKLQFVIDPEGHTYARYILVPTDSTEIKNAAEELQKQEEESKEKPAFYFPETVEKQAEALHIGQQITIYQCDGWILSSINGGAGTVTGFYIGDYAQYKNVLYIELIDKRGRITKTHIRNDKECLIYEGIKPALPESVTCREIRTGTGYTMKEMFNYNELIPNTYNYYKSIGETPIIDTWQR